MADSVADSASDPAAGPVAGPAAGPVLTAAPAPRAALDPVVGWRAEYGPGEYVADPAAYLTLDRTRLRALAICVFHAAGADVVAELRCPGAVFRRRVALSSDGTRAVAWLLGCPCHDQLLRIDGAGAAPAPDGFASVVLFPQERR